MRDKIVSREELLAAASATLAGCPAATMAEIARGAGVSRATLHRAFASREALLRAIALDMLATVEAQLAEMPLRHGDPVEVLGLMAAAWVPLGARFHFIGSDPALERDGELAGRLAGVGAAVGGVMARGRAAGALRDDLPVEWQASVFLDLIYRGWAAVAEQLLVPRDAVGAVMVTFLAGQRCGAAARARGAR